MDEVAGRGDQDLHRVTAAPTDGQLSASTPCPPRRRRWPASPSAGPAIAGGGDLLKPDITAPGVDVIAAVSPAGDNGNLYDAESGTSMSSPHIAGIAALLDGKHPTWSPWPIKSALMTTASQTDNTAGRSQRDGVDATPFDFGSGHVQPAPAFDPGLVYDSSPTDWIRYGCGINQIQLVTSACVVRSSARSTLAI